MRFALCHVCFALNCVPLLVRCHFATLHIGPYYCDCYQIKIACVQNLPVEK